MGVNGKSPFFNAVIEIQFGIVGVNGKKPFFVSLSFLFRLQAMKREIHLRELQLLDAVRRRFMHHQQTLKETELQRLDDEIERKVSLSVYNSA